MTLVDAPHDSSHGTDFPSVGSVADVARYLRVGRNAAYSLVASGQLRSVRVGSAIRVTRAALNEFLGENEPAPTLRPVEAGQEDSRGTGRRTQA